MYMRVMRLALALLAAGTASGASVVDGELPSNMSELRDVIGVRDREVSCFLPYADVFLQMLL